MASVDDNAKFEVSDVTRPVVGGYQRLTVEDVKGWIEKIREKAEEGDHEEAHWLEDKLYLSIIQKLAHRGSRIAKAALEAKKITFPRRMA